MRDRKGTKAMSEQREMTLEEVLASLPRGHRALRELEELKRARWRCETTQDGKRCVLNASHHDEVKEHVFEPAPQCAETRGGKEPWSVVSRCRFAEGHDGDHEFARDPLPPFSKNVKPGVVFETNGLGMGGGTRILCGTCLEPIHARRIITDMQAGTLIAAWIELDHARIAAALPFERVCVHVREMSTNTAAGYHDVDVDIESRTCRTCGVPVEPAGALPGVYSHVVEPVAKPS
jgi:hypothetical protein